MLFSVLSTMAQTTSDYDRSTLGYVTLNHSDSKYNDLIEKSINKVRTTNKFFQNRVSTTFIKAGGTTSEIESVLRQNRIPAQTLSDWRNVDILVERGRYNLNDQEVQRLRATSRGFESGTKNEEWFGKLVKNTFIIVIDFVDIKTMNEVYNEQEQRNRAASGISGSTPSSVVRNENGFEAKADIYIFKLRMDVADYANLLKSDWKDNQSHNRYDYAIDFIKKVNIKCEATQSIQGNQKSEQALFDVLLQDAVEKASDKLPTGYKGFEAKEAIISNFPVKAKLGKKEDLKIDKLFFVYEFKEGRNGNKKAKRKGTVRVKNIVDNRYVATGNSDASTFYKVGLGRYKEGMFLSEKSDKSISIGIGKVAKPFDGYFGRITYNLSPLINKNNLTQLKVFAEGGLSFTVRDENKLFIDYEAQFGSKFSNANKMSLYYYGIGIEKDFYILPFLQISPNIGFYQEEVEYKNYDLIEIMAAPSLSPLSAKIVYGKIGVGLPLNLTYNVKITPTFSYATRSYQNKLGLGSVDAFASNYNSNLVLTNSLFFQLNLKIEL
jgi:hypothetical protein